MTVPKSYISIFNRSGQMLDELILPCVRSWLINTHGKAEFVIPRTHAAFTRTKMALRNPVVIKTPGLPDWGGFLWTPRKRNADGSVVISAYSAELMLSLRQSPGFSGSAGSIFRDIIGWANFSEATLIDIGDVQDSIQSFTDLGRPPSDLYAALQALISGTGLEYEIVPVRNATTGNLAFQANLRVRISRSITGFALTEGQNIKQPNDAVMTEQGNIANSITIYRPNTAGQYVVTYFVSDPESMSEFGLCEQSITVEAESQTSDAEIASAALREGKRPVRTFRLEVINRSEGNGGHTFDYLRLGNELTIASASLGFQGENEQRTIGRITGMSYTDKTNTCELTVEELVI